MSLLHSSGSAVELLVSNKRQERFKLIIYSLQIFVALLTLLAVFSVFGVKHDVTDLGAALVDDVDGINGRLTGVETDISVLRGEVLPKAYAVDFVSPVKSQASRGTCWDFSTMSLLEASYMSYGVEKGFLQPNQYVAFSEQAYGRATVDVAVAHPERYPDLPYRPQGKVSDGFAYEIAVSFDDLKDKILPHAVCPYVPTEGCDCTADGCVATSDGVSDCLTQANTDLVCDGYAEAIAANPILLTKMDMRTAISRSDIKRAIVESAHAVPFSIILTKGAFYIPCTVQAYATTDQCLNATHLCPEHLGLGDGALCYMYQSASTKDGIFVTHEDPVMRGGHAMNLVGYNDEFVVDAGISETLTGLTRGVWIIKNSWDTSASHTIDYYLQKHSSRAENMLCPNVNYAPNWTPCNPDDYADEFKERPETVELLCSGAHGVVDCDQSYSYCLESWVSSVDDTVTATLREWKPAEGQTKDAGFQTLVLPPLTMDTLSRMFTPTDEYMAANPNAPECGFYGYPYVLEALSDSLFGEFWVLPADVEFSDCSYVANKETCLVDHPEYAAGYDLIEASTGTVQRSQFVLPMPYSMLGM
jgi:hypothetical protein